MYFICNLYVYAFIFICILSCTLYVFFERIPIVRFRRAKSLKDILVRAKVARHVEVLDAKYANMLLLLEHLDLLVPKENIALIPIT